MTTVVYYLHRGRSHLPAGHICIYRAGQPAFRNTNMTYKLISFHKPVQKCKSTDTDHCNRSLPATAISLLFVSLAVLICLPRLKHFQKATHLCRLGKPSLMSNTHIKRLSFLTLLVHMARHRPITTQKQAMATQNVDHAQGPGPLQSSLRYCIIVYARHSM